MTHSAAPPAADRPAHYRLGDETWALILKEYREGATAPFLAGKWRVSEAAVRRRATKHKSTKRDWGDEQAISQAVAREAELEEARRNSPEAWAARLFDDMDKEPPEAGDPGVLARVATLASGRAMMKRLWSEAKALAGLAESYARLGEKGGGGGTIETMSLDLLMEIRMDPDGRVASRFERKRGGGDDPDEALKTAYWDWETRRHRAVSNSLRELLLRAVSAERLAKSLGGEPKVNHTDVEIETWAREWLSGPPSEANVRTRTQLGEWPWR